VPPFAGNSGAVRTPEPRRFPVDRRTFEQLKGRANNDAGSRGEGPDDQQVPDVNARFPGLDSTQGGGWNPPDAALAVGPNHVLTAVNEAFAVYGRDGQIEAGGVKQLAAFFGATDSVFDPKALYDKGRDRFVLLAVSEHEDPDSASFMLAVSNTGDPTGAWCTYKLNAITDEGKSTAAWADFPGLGMDGDYLYITSNQFAFNGGSFQYARILAIPKSEAYQADCSAIANTRDFLPLQNPGGGASFTVQPADQPDATQGSPTPMYFVNAIWSSGNNLVLRSITGSQSGPALTDPQWVSNDGGGTIAAYNIPADAPQPRGRAIDTGDTRLLGAVYRYGRVYTSNTTRTVGVSGVRGNAYANGQWYEIEPKSGGSYAARGSFAVADNSTAFYFPAVIPGGCSGDARCNSLFVALEVSGSSTKTAASAFAVFHRPDRRTVARIASPAPSATGYTLSGRWGDYAAVAADPAPTNVWMLGEYAKTSGSWGTLIATVNTDGVTSSTTPTP
jgi:hypothetical protein